MLRECYSMGSIIPVGEKWRAQVRRKGYKAQTKTFALKKDAEAWARKIEAGIDQAGPVVQGDEMTVADMLDSYREMRMELGRPVSPTTNTHYMLTHLTEDLGPELVRDLTPQRLARWAKERREQGAGGYTVNMELSALGTALRHTASFLNIVVPDVVGAARPLLHYGQLISGGNKRTRRPTEDELTRLLAWLQERNPILADAVRVAAITGMRRAELARIVWADIDAAKKAVLVRQRKHPRRIEARDELVPLLGDSWAVVQRQPKTDERIFPVSREALTDAVTAGTKALDIPNLHLHDMRREATSAMRDLGFDASARKAVTGHRSDAAHEIYVAVDLQKLHEQFDAAQGKSQHPPRRRKASGHLP